MNHLPLILPAIDLAAAALILARSACALNRMGPGIEHHLERVFFSIAATAAVAVLCAPLWDRHHPQLVGVLLHAGGAGIVAGPWLCGIVRTRLGRNWHG